MWMRDGAIADNCGTFTKPWQRFNRKSGSYASALKRSVDYGEFGEVSFGVFGYAEDEESAVVVRHAARAGVLVGGLDDALRYFVAGVGGSDRGQESPQAVGAIFFLFLVHRLVNAVRGEDDNVAR
jgi:hypothetical protein